MVRIERVQRPFWMHQLVEYVLAFALIMTSIQQPEPRVPALMGLLILVNAALVAGPAGAFKLVPRRLHKWLDLVVIGLLVLMSVQPWFEVDESGRIIMIGIAVVMAFIWFHSDFTERAERKAAKAAARAEREPLNSTNVGNTAGRYVGHGVNTAKRWKAALGAREDLDVSPPAAADPPPPSPPSSLPPPSFPPPAEPPVSRRP